MEDPQYLCHVVILLLYHLEGQDLEELKNQSHDEGNLIANHEVVLRQQETLSLSELNQS